VSAEDSFFARIFSFKFSASLRAAAILSWMSPACEDMILRVGGWTVGGFVDRQTAASDNDWAAKEDK
jgi:hypothetical protein